MDNKNVSKALDNSKAQLTDSQRDAFDHSAKRSLINIDGYKGDTFSLFGFQLKALLDDFILVKYVDLSEDGTSVMRGGIWIPLAQVNKSWRQGQVLLKGPNSTVEVGDIVTFPDDKGIKVDNLTVKGFEGSQRNCVFLNEERIFGICEPLEVVDEG